MKVEIVSEPLAGGVVLRLRGDVDMNTSPDVRAAMAELFRSAAPSTKALVVDLSQVRYLDSSGIATLVECMQNCMKKGMRLRLAELSPSVRDVFDLARLSGVFEIYATMADAAAGL